MRLSAQLGIRTQTKPILSRLPLPIGIEGQMAGEPGFEPGRVVLETARLPLSYSPSPSFVVT